MDFLFDNPLANLDGPSFLVLYSFLIISTIIGYRVLKNRLDQSAHFAVPPIPSNPDAFEIAYLRGGANELARAVVFSLAHKNLLTFESGEKISRIHVTEGQIDRRDLSPMQLTALDWLGKTRDTNELFKKDGLANALKPFYENYQARLEMQHFFPDEEMKKQNKHLAIKAFLVFGALGAYKFLAALYNGYTNVLGIIVLTLIGLFILGAMSKMPRLTKLGQTYLERLQLAFDRIRPSNHNADIYKQNAPEATVAAIDPFLLSVGVFGGAALAGTVYSDYNRAFERAQHQSAASSSGCSTGCGSSSCSSSDGSSSGDGGSSCGGGCGGCGGGGD
ncbi:MAG TPA: TIGR04222 domain-containing membrane protein [Pyrinomonadaceae bacterium]|nr:TIGR04222 domain-containing membrane protein [Pyrinomonadaceae bacterium]